LNLAVHNLESKVIPGLVWVSKLAVYSIFFRKMD